MTSSDEPSPSSGGSVPPGATFGRYEIRRLLGAGGMGSVYEARQIDLERRVALKVLKKQLAKNRIYLERFLREGRIAARLDHPHVVSVFDVGTHEGSPFLVMEFLSGRDLDAHLKEHRVLEVDAAIDIILPVLSALDAAHRMGLVHRDVKPANIFLARAPHGGLHPKLLDFGIAKANADDEEALTATSDVFGTPQFMAPEQVRRSRAATARSDQYAMGVVLYRALVGRDAFEIGESSIFEVLERVVAGTFPPPRAIRSELPEQLEQILLRAMARSPDDRYPSIQGFGAALLPFASAMGRKTWGNAFSQPDATAATAISLSNVASMTSSSEPSVPSAAEAASAPSPVTPRPETLAAASRDASPDPSRHARTVEGSVPLRRLFVGVAVGLGASLLVFGALTTFKHRGNDSGVVASPSVSENVASERVVISTADAPSVGTPTLTVTVGTPLSSEAAIARSAEPPAPPDPRGSPHVHAATSAPTPNRPAPPSATATVPNPPPSPASSYHIE